MRTPSTRLLIVEDDQSLAVAQRRLLQTEGFKTDVVSTGEAAVGAAHSGVYDLVILDIGLPGYDGFEVIRRLRQLKNQVPILVVTARGYMNDKVRGLDLGADDYMVKPFDTSELVARAKALVRRAQANSGGQLTNGPLVMDTQARRAYLNGEALELTAREWTVLGSLLANVEKIVPKERLIQILGKASEEVSVNAVEVYVSRLRSKLEGEGISIRTVRGFGYLMEAYSRATEPQRRKGAK